MCVCGGGGGSFCFVPHSQSGLPQKHNACILYAHIQRGQGVIGVEEKHFYGGVIIFVVNSMLIY